MDSGDIPRLATSAPERSSGGANRQHWRLNPGVYETGASPVLRTTRSGCDEAHIDLDHLTTAATRDLARSQHVKEFGNKGLRLQDRRDRGRHHDDCQARANDRSVPRDPERRQAVSNSRPKLPKGLFWRPNSPYIWMTFRDANGRRI